MTEQSFSTCKCPLGQVGPARPTEGLGHTVYNSRSLVFNVGFTPSQTLSEFFCDLPLTYPHLSHPPPHIAMPCIPKSRKTPALNALTWPDLAWPASRGLQESTLVTCICKNRLWTGLGPSL